MSEPRNNAPKEAGGQARAGSDDDAGDPALGFAATEAVPAMRAPPGPGPASTSTSAPAAGGGDPAFSDSFVGAPTLHGPVAKALAEAAASAEEIAPLEPPRSSSTLKGIGALTGRTVRVTSSNLQVGTVLAERYQIIERLSQGGMGVVYKARHTALDNEVAIKVLIKPQQQEDQDRFLQEARLASKINHPNTVYISDFGVLPDGRAYLAMEFLRGKTLAEVIREGPLDMLRVCKIATQIALGLQAVHDKGIVHRDLKPENVFLLEHEGTQDFVKIVDFGIAEVKPEADCRSILPLDREVLATQRVTDRKTCRGREMQTTEYYPACRSAYVLPGSESN